MIVEVSGKKFGKFSVVGGGILKCHFLAKIAVFSTFRKTRFSKSGDLPFKILPKKCGFGVLPKTHFFCWISLQEAVFFDFLRLFSVWIGFILKLVVKKGVQIYCFFRKKLFFREIMILEAWRKINNLGEKKLEISLGVFL